jgi:hypothetical protein
MRSLRIPIRRLLYVLISVVAVNAFGFDYDGHRMINQLALASLPKE